MLSFQALLQKVKKQVSGQQAKKRRISQSTAINSCNTDESFPEDGGVVLHSLPTPSWKQEFERCSLEPG